MLIGVVIIICLAILMFLTLRPSKAEKQAKAEMEERLKDERIYHPETGRYFTLEELENGVIKVDNDYPRIKSDEEIEAHYTEEEKEIEYTVRLMLQSDFAQTEDERVYALIDGSELFESSDSHGVYLLWTIKPEHFLGIAQVSYSLRNGKYEYADSESQIVGIVQGDILADELKKFADIEINDIGNTRVFRIPRKINYHEFKKIVELLSASARD